MKKLSLWFLNFVRRFNKYRYVANTMSMEIHDLGHEHVNCQVDEIKNYQLIDKYTMLDLMKDKYNGCAYCMPNFNKELDKLSVNHTYFTRFGK